VVVECLALRLRCRAQRHLTRGDVGRGYWSRRRGR
jgi:hypothetical protein